MGLISRNNSRFPQLAILHVIAAQGLSLFWRCCLSMCRVHRTLEKESAPIQKQITLGADQMRDSLPRPLSFEQTLVVAGCEGSDTAVPSHGHGTDEQSYSRKKRIKERQKKTH